MPTDRLGTPPNIPRPGVIGGYAPLDSGLLIPTAYLPVIPASKTPAEVEAWDQYKVKSTDQSVTNSTTLTDDSELSFQVGSAETWYFEVVILYSSDATGDFKFVGAITAGDMLGWYRLIGTDNTANAVGTITASKYNGVATFGTALGGGSTTIIRTAFIEGMSRMNGGTTTFKMQFAQQTQTAGQSAVMRAGSILRAKMVHV
jgi:hypothetical protein